MAAVESTFAETESPWPPANLDPSRHPGWHSLYACDRLPMAGFAERLSAVPLGPALLLRLAGSQRAAGHKSCLGRAPAPGGRTQALSLGWYYRQQEREDHGKWRSMRV